MTTPDNPAAATLDAERARLRSAGYTDAEVSQILIARASQQPGGTGQGVMSNVLSSIMAVGSHARAVIPSFRKDVATIFDGAATASARAGATASLIIKAVVILVLGYAAWQEWNQHIVSQTEITAQNAEKAKWETLEAKTKAHAISQPAVNLSDAIFSPGAFTQDSLKAKTEFDAGHYDEAFKIESATASAAEAFELKTSGKAGTLTADFLAQLSWYALFARQYADALNAAERSIKLKPSLNEETNHAHALMLLGRSADAKAIYLAHKGEPLNGKNWEEVIADDFAKLRKAGIESPLMAEIERALSSFPPAGFKPPEDGFYDSQGKKCEKTGPNCHWLCRNGAVLCV